MRNGGDALKHLSYALQSGLSKREAMKTPVGEIIDLWMWQMEFNTMRFGGVKHGREDD